MASESKTPLEALRESFRGDVIAPDDEGYEAACHLWNRALKPKPSLILRAAGVADCVAAVKYAASEAGGGKMTVCGGGHGFNSKLDGVVCLELNAHMKSVVVDAGAKTAWVEAGAKVGDMDTAAAVFGLATPGGMVSDTGIGGLATGGGIGWLSRSMGLMVDNVLEAHVLTAAGEVVTASATSNPDLFWAIRGGGSHCGVVLAFKLRLEEVGLVRGGPLVHPPPAAAAAMKKAVATAAGWGNEFTFIGAWAHGPDGSPCFMSLPFAREVSDAADAAFKPLMEDPAPVAVMNGPMPYPVINTLIDAPNAPTPAYERALLVHELSDEVVDILAEAYGKVPSKKTAIVVEQLGGKISDVAADATVYSARSAKWWIVFLALHDEAESEATIAWTDDAFERVKAVCGPFSEYINAVSSVEHTDPYRANKARLAEVKAKWNPAGVFDGAKRL